MEKSCRSTARLHCRTWDQDHTICLKALVFSERQLLLWLTSLVNELASKSKPGHPSLSIA
jgi:hypothetical protein